MTEWPGDTVTQKVAYTIGGCLLLAVIFLVLAFLLGILWQLVTWVWS